MGSIRRTKTMKEKLYIIDISNFMHRAFHAVGDLRTSRGLPVGAIFGTVNMMMKFIRDNKPKNIVVCYDSHGKNFRHKIFPEYKANRGPTNEAVSTQEQIIRAIIKSLGMYSVIHSDYEADDLIASVTKRFKDQYDIVIMTGDKDMLQLIDDNVKVYDSMKKTYYSEKDIDKKFGVRSEQIADYLALVGDRVDNISGVPGIGPVGARKLLNVHNTIDDIYNNLDSIQNPMRSKLEKNHEIAVLSKTLTSLFSETPLKITNSDIRFVPRHDTRLIDLLRHLEFNTVISQLTDIYILYKDQKV